MQKIFRIQVGQRANLKKGNKIQMKAMILAAGEGTRLKPLTYQLPKPLVPILNKPVMAHVLSCLSKNDIQEIVINTHYMADQIESYFKDGAKFNVKIQYSREEKLLGTAGGVKKVESLFQETFLVIGADDLSDVNLKQLIKSHKLTRAVASIGLKEVEKTEHYGIVVTDPTGKILQFQEKPQTDKTASRTANTGIYVFEPEIFNFIPENEVFDFGRQVFPLLLKKNATFYGFPVEGYWCDIGSLEEYKNSHWSILSGECKIDLDAPQISPRIWISEGAKIHPEAVLRPPCYVGKGTVVEKGAVLDQYVVAGENARIGAKSHLNRTILWDETVIPPEKILENSVIAE